MTSAVSAAASGGALSTYNAKTDFSTEAFMELLIAELQNQDPLEPLDSKEMMDQLTQLTMVSQLSELGDVLGSQSSYRITEVSALIGRSVEWADETSGERLSGVVDKATYGSAGWTVQVGGDAVPVDAIISVR